MVNHSKRSPDKRYRFSRDRWSHNGISSNVAEGNNTLLKRSFKSYVWINPKYSQLYLNEYSFLGNLRYYNLENLLPEESRTQPSNPTRLDRHGEMRGLDIKIIHWHKRRQRTPLREVLAKYEYNAGSLVEIEQNITRTKEQEIQNRLSQISNQRVKNILSRRYREYKHWTKTKSTLDQKRAQRDYLELAELVYQAIPDDGYVDLQELAWQLKIPSKKLFRLVGIWVKYDLIEIIDLNRYTKGKEAWHFDMRRKAELLTPLLYIIPKEQTARFNRSWRNKAKQNRRFK